jgi:hydrogenase maturation protease
MARTLVVGYGNLDRGDDGVAYHIVNGLRRSLGQPALDEYETGLEELGKQVDSVFLTQLGPEFVDVLVNYDRIIFVDAHVLLAVDGLYCARVLPEFTQSTFTHHMTPATLLALLSALYHRDAEAHLVSARGHRFEFERDLSEATQALVEPAVASILELLTEPGQAAAELERAAQSPEPDPNKSTQLKVV